MLKKKYNHLTGCIKYQLLIYIYLFFQWIVTVYTKSINVTNEDELKNAFELNYSDIILQSSISIGKKYILNSSLTNKNVKISGKSSNIALSFRSEQDGFYFNAFENIEISSLIFIGNVNFENCTKISFTNIEFNGLINGKNSDISIYQSEYYNTQSIKSMYGIYLDNTLLEIKKSKFYGGESLNYIIFITDELSEDKNIDLFSGGLTISESYFSGEYNSGIINVNVKSEINIQNSEFVKGYSDFGLVLNSYIYFI